MGQGAFIASASNRIHHDSGVIGIGEVGVRPHRIGSVYPGLVPGRDDDVAGLYGAWGHFSADQRAAQRRAGQPGQVYEAVLELNYRVNVLPWFYLQPDLQGIINPGAAHRIDDALVLALQFGVPF